MDYSNTLFALFVEQQVGIWTKLSQIYLGQELT